jgi:hypothetical protein
MLMVYGIINYNFIELPHYNSFNLKKYYMLYNNE